MKTIFKIGVFFLFAIIFLHFSGIWPIPAIDQLLNGDSEIISSEEIKSYGAVSPVRKIEYFDAEVFAGDRFSIKIKRGLNDGLNSCLPFKFLKTDTVFYSSQKKAICTYVIDFRNKNVFFADTVKKTFYIVDQIIPDCKCGSYEKIEYFEPSCLKLDEIPNEKTQMNILQKKDFADNTIESTFKKMMNEHPKRNQIIDEGIKVKNEIITYYNNLGYTQVNVPEFLN